MRIIGVHPVVDADEPCCLFEIESEVEIDWRKVTQKVEGEAEANWQVPWLEQKLNGNRWAFFLHYVKFDRPLLTQFESIKLPPVSPMPLHLKSIRYEPPD
jgi:hypothetical protein